MLFELREERDLALLLDLSQKQPVVIFKHSTQCSRSEVAESELRSFIQDHPDVPCGRVLVIEERRLSDSMEERFGILHESPQAIVLLRGCPVWHASHRRVTAEALESAIAAARPVGA